ncbi:MAG: hypothetical protein Q7R56_00375 [Nanoarchaeota archaeon]|nr:hypothetical protein [Nanoarchaeota archaeon]
MRAYKEKCRKCKKQYALVTSSKQWPLCKDCELKEISKPITDQKMKKFFDIPQAYYDQSSFLRSIKRNYLHFENLSDKQKEFFIKVVKEFKQGIAREQQPQTPQEKKIIPTLPIEPSAKKKRKRQEKKITQ